MPKAGVRKDEGNEAAKKPKKVTFKSKNKFEALREDMEVDSDDEGDNMLQMVFMGQV